MSLKGCPFPTGYEPELSFLDRSSPHVIDMNDAKLVTVEQLRGFLAGSADLALTPSADPAARYGFIKRYSSAPSTGCRAKPNAA